MTEREFIKQNKEKWEALESQLQGIQKDPDVLVDLFVKVSGDLSYARTFFPNRSVRLYLNGLTQKVFDQIGKRKKRIGFFGIKYFFRHTLPQGVIKSKNAFFLSLGVFVIAVAIGVISTAHDPDFPVLILGHDYVKMTNENINNGDPMAVYKDDGMVDMFLGITINNIRVSMLAFVLGLLGTLGTIILLLHNGIMLGTFQYFFYQKGLFATSFFTIWIHGTIEISSIIIAGAAGIVLGNSILFPKTHGRWVSLQKGAYRSLRILLGTVPLFIVAGLLESFVTRHTQWPMWIKAGIIVVSLLLILYMWVIYPWIYSKTQFIAKDTRIEINPSAKVELNGQRVNSLGEISAKSLVLMRGHLTWLVKYAIMPVWLFIFTGTWIYYKIVVTDETISNSLFHYSNGGWQMFLIYTFAFTYVVCAITIRMQRFHLDVQEVLGFIKYSGLRVLMSMSVLFSIVYFLPHTWLLLGILILPIHFFFSFAIDIANKKERLPNKLQYYLKYSYKSYGPYIILLALVSIIGTSLFSLFQEGLGAYISGFLEWHGFGLEDGYSAYWLSNGLISLGPIVMIILGVYMSSYLFFYTENKHFGADLYERLSSFGSHLDIE